MVFNRLPPFKSILELLSLISTLCVFRFLFSEFSFSAFEVPRFLGIPQRITGSLLIQILLRIQIRLHLSLFNFQGPARSPLSRTAYILYHTFLCLSICFFAFFRGFSGLLSPALSSDSFAIITNLSRLVNTFFKSFFFFFWKRILHYWQKQRSCDITFIFLSKPREKCWQRADALL